MGAIAIAAIGDNANIYLPVQFFFFQLLQEILVAHDVSTVHSSCTLLSEAVAPAN